MTEDRGKWVKNSGNPIIIPTQSWEGTMVAEPKTIVESDGSFTMFYSGNWTTPGIGRATATAASQGNSFTKSANNPVIGQGAAGIAKAVHHFARKLTTGPYTGAYEIIFADNDVSPACLYRALSTDGIGDIFNVRPEPILQNDSNYTYLANPCIVEIGDGREIMLYTALNTSGIWVLLQAERADENGWVWLKNSRGPASSSQIGTGVYDTVTVKQAADGLFYGHSINALSGVLPTDIYSFKTNDLFNYTALNGSLPSIWRTQAFEVDQCADPCLIDHFAFSGKQIMFYSGMDNPSSAGKIGRAEYVGTFESLMGVPVPYAPGVVDYLIVGGGAEGSDGGNYGAGASGAQVKIFNGVTLASGTHAVVVGAAGVSFANGGQSSFNGTIALGGKSPGSGGTTGANSPGTHVGGASAGTNGGGGGATDNGDGNAASSSYGGDGARGTHCDFSGTDTVYGAAGGGAGYYGPGYGYDGGGTAGWNYGGTPNGSNATTPGSSGGGAVNSTPGLGMEGIILIRYYGPLRDMGGIVSHVNGYTIHEFVANGSYTVP